MDKRLFGHSPKLSYAIASSEIDAGRKFLSYSAVWLSFAAEVVMIVVITVTTLADAKARFSEIVASAEATHERTTITKNGRPAVVIIAAEDLDSLEETLAIMSDPELLKAVRDRAGEPAEPISKEDMLARIAARQA